jgi:hypothetical protein
MDSKGKVIDIGKVFRGLRIAIVLSLLISAILILLTLDSNSLKNALNSIKPQIIIYLLITLFLSWLAAGLGLKIMITTIGGNLTLKEGIVLYLSGSFISYVTPFATGGGPFQVYLLHKKGINIGQATMVILTQFVLRIIFFTFAGTIFLLFFNHLISPGAVPPYIFYLAFGTGFLITTSLIIFSLVPRITDKIVGKLFKIDKLRNFVKNNYKAKKLLAKIRIEIREFHESMELLSQYKLKLLLSGLCTFFYWSTLFMVIPLILIGLGLEPHFFRAYVMQTIFNLVIPYMPTPGASGIAEVGFASVFISFIPKGLIGIVTILWRFITFYLILIIGGFFALRELGWKRRKKHG